jgi:ATP-dependent Lon protease
MSFSAYWSARFADLSDPAVPIDNPSELPDLPDVPDTTDLANVTVVTDDDDQEAPIVQGESPLPETLPILPVLGLVVFPQTAIPLTIAQPRSIRLIDSVAAGERLVGLVAAKDPDKDMPGPDDLYTVGTLAAIPRLMRTPDGTIRVLAQGLLRFRIDSYVSTEPFLTARVSPAPETMTEGLEVEAITRTITDQFTRLGELVPSIPEELISSALAVDSPLQLVYAVATSLRLSLEDQQAILELDTLTEKLHLLMIRLGKELEVLELGRKIQDEAQSEMEKMQREYFLREQLKAIQKELGEGDEQTVEVEEFRTKIEAAHMPPEPLKEAKRELDRLSRLPTAAAEYGVIRTYLDWLVSLPWATMSADNLDLKHARQVLDTDHYGLVDIKDRIIEFLAVRKLRVERGAALNAEESAQKSDNKGDELDLNGVSDIDEDVTLSDEAKALIALLANKTALDHANDKAPDPANIPTADAIRREREGAILCFVGPPGVGKTSLGASIARAMDRKFIRLSLGGIRDEADLRGFRRTYVGAAPGSLIQTLRRVGTRNPIIMLDEIDKLGRDFRGDPASALLEVLDPEQNNDFRDHYLDVPFDLSRVLFITTANELDPIPPPLRDRMEIIHLSGYTEQEKIEIALQYLVPRQRRDNLLHENELTFTREAIQLLVRDYTREAGVRNLDREIGRLARKIATQIAEGLTVSAVVDPEAVRLILGRPRFGYRDELTERTNRPGVATGLSVTSVGGDVLFVEAAQMPGNKGFQYTGQLGEVMQESARAAFSYVRSQAEALGLDPKYFETHDIHLHVPAGAIPKDGPSAGVTMATALASLVSGRPVRSNIAMTGEITLRGLVLPVGGIKDKILAAHRFGVDTVILPYRNEPDLDDLPAEVRESLHFVLAKRIEEVLAAALEAMPTELKIEAEPQPIV